VVIVGAGAAGAAAAEALRREGYQGPITVIGAEDGLPVDRPVLSKGYLSGKAAEEWVPLRPAAFYSAHGIGMLTGRRIASIDRPGRLVLFDDGEALPYGALLLATGAEPIRLPAPGADLPHVHTLRSLADARAVIAGAASVRRAVVIGASFIGLEVAASLVARGLEVHVVAPEPVPLARILGDEIGTLVRSVHEGHGVSFHLGHTASSVTPEAVVLEDGTELDAGIVVAGIGVRPRVELASNAGLLVDKGVVVDQFLATSDPAIWAAGDIALWPHPRFGPIRVEHWVAAERQGQTAAANILSARRPHTDVPFFWTKHFDFGINYVGRATSWDEVHIAGSVAGRDFTAAYLEKGRVLAVATANRDRKCLEATIAFERGDEGALERIATGD
jgi:NADPH-dependent 2,4-dienoyl-CoA reductase/sulfur reductase-like enzyme